MDPWVTFDVSEVTWAEPHNFGLNFLPHSHVRVNGVVGLLSLHSGASGAWEFALPEYDHIFEVYDARLVVMHKQTGGALQLKTPSLVVAGWKNGVAHIRAPQSILNATHIRVRMDVGFIQ